MHEDAIRIGWHGENFARMGKAMKNLDEHLKPGPSPEAARESGARKVAAMFDRLIRRQGEPAVSPLGAAP